MDAESRFRFYLGSLYKAVAEGKTIQYKEPPPFAGKVIPDNNIRVTREQLVSEFHVRHMECYRADFARYIAAMSRKEPFEALVNLGDGFRPTKQHVISKFRIIGEATPTVLLFLNSRRHYFDIVPKLPSWDVPWAAKDSKLVWRGVPTGFGKGFKPRMSLVSRHQAHPNKNIDIKFSSSYAFFEGWCKTNGVKEKFDIAGPMSVQHMLKSKFLVSVEGNDVASNLKWALASNSCVLMPRPTVVSWFMEHMLKPGVHYVEVKPDFSDLESKYKWCLEHDEQCRVIAENGKAFMKHFANRDEEIKLNARVLDAYVSAIKFSS